MKNQIRLSVVIPAYNETDNFRRGSLNQVTQFLSGQDYRWELIIVNDGSSDDTLKLLRDFALGKSGVRIIDNPHQGKAASIITGAKISRGDYVIFSDMDQATPITEVPKLLQAFSSGYDIVIGSRSNRKGAPLLRKILAYGMIILRTILLRLPFHDTQCGFKGFTRSSAAKIFTIIDRAHPSRSISGAAVNPGFDVELLYLGRKLGFRILEVPVIWHHQDTKRVRFVKDAVAGIRELFLVRWRSLTNVYQLK